MDWTKIKVGFNLVSPLTGKIFFQVLRITDGTVNTTFTRHVYGKTNQQGDFIRDAEGKIPIVILDHPPENDPKLVEKYKFYKPLPPPDDILPDKADKFIWWVEDPEIEEYEAGAKTQIINGQIVRVPVIQQKFLSGQKKGAYEEFEKAFELAYERVEMEKREAEKAQKEKDAELARETASALVSKMTENEEDEPRKPRKRKGR